MELLKKPIYLLVMVLLLISILAGGKVIYELFFREPPAAGREVVDIRIPRGSSLYRIAAILEKAELIHSRKFFRNAVIVLGKGTAFKSGFYRFPGNSSMYDLIQLLEEGKTVQLKVTVPEGRRMIEIFELFREAGLSGKNYHPYVRDADFIESLGLPKGVTSLEGFLFPETYQFPLDISEKEMLQVMVKTFFKKLPADYKKMAEKVGLSFYEAVILASIIEKETGAATERKTISSVFHNRLKKKMRLQTDPTVIYGIKNFNGNLTRRDLKRYTPYNTYVIRGLPPTPIANPGLASLIAAVQPAETEYLYFVARGNGKHKFSSTYRDHNRAVYRYQKKRTKNYKSY